MVRCLWIPQQSEGEESQIQQRTCLVVKWSISKTYRFSFLSLISNRYVICLNAFSKRPISMLFTSNLNNFSIKGTNFNSFSSSSHHHLFLLLLHRHRLPYWLLLLYETLMKTHYKSYSKRERDGHLWEVRVLRKKSSWLCCYGIRIWMEWHFQLMSLYLYTLSWY